MTSTGRMVRGGGGVVMMVMIIIEGDQDSDEHGADNGDCRL